MVECLAQLLDAMYQARQSGSRTAPGWDAQRLWSASAEEGLALERLFPDGNAQLLRPRKRRAVSAYVPTQLMACSILNVECLNVYYSYLWLCMSEDVHMIYS